MGPKPWESPGEREEEGGLPLHARLCFVLLFPALARGKFCQ